MEKIHFTKENTQEQSLPENKQCRYADGHFPNLKWCSNPRTHKSYCKEHYIKCYAEGAKIPHTIPPKFIFGNQYADV